MKYPIAVIEWMNKKGQVKPLYVIYQEKTYKVERILRKKDTRDGKLMFECQIAGRLKILYFMNERWYIEKEY